MSTQSKRPRVDPSSEAAKTHEVSSSLATAPHSSSTQAAPTSLEAAISQSVDAMEVLSSILPVPDKALWIMMFENGTWIKNALEKVYRVLPDVGVFTIDFVMHTIQDGKGESFEVPYYFLTLCQELKERNGIAFFQYPLHYASLSQRYIDIETAKIEEKNKALAAAGKPVDESLDVEMPYFAALISQLLGSLRNSTDRAPLLGERAEPSEPVSNQAKLVTLSLETRADMVAEMIVVKPLSNNPFRDGKSKSKKSQTSMFASVNLGTLYEEYNKSHCAVDSGAASASQHFMTDMNFESFDFRYSVHNLSSADMHHILTKTVVSRQAPREYLSAQTQSGSMLDGDVLARFRLFTITHESTGNKPALVFNIQVFNYSTKQLFDVRFPTQVHTLTEQEYTTEKRQLYLSSIDKMQQSLLRRVRFVRVEAPLMDDDFLSSYEPTATETKFDEYYAARTLAPLFASGGSETFTLYFGFPKDTAGHAVRRHDVAGYMLIEVNRVAVDDRIAQLMIFVNPLDTTIHSNLSRTKAVAENENPFAESATAQ